MKTKYNLPFDIFLLNENIEQGYVTSQTHPNGNYLIYNYTAKAQYERVWNEVTLQCRGLILDRDLNIVARPFKKFFNYEEVVDILPLSSFRVFEKMDGSLGILYWDGDMPHIATRGSFISEQSQKATAMLHSTYQAALNKLDNTKTYLFEIIYPENRIVVNYGSEEKLVLLSIIDKATGNEEELQNIGFPLIETYDGFDDLKAIREIHMDNKEGFVIKYENDFRVKVKFEEYVRLHRIVTMVSNKVIWENIRNNQSFAELLEKVPDEFYNWVKQTIADFRIKYDEIEREAKSEFKEFPTRKESAEYYQTCKYPQILFKMLDKGDYSEIIWKLLKPKFEKPFSNNNNEEI